jgi:hypothetical protein
MDIQKFTKTIWAYRGLDVDQLLPKLLNASGQWISYTKGHSVKGDSIYIFPTSENIEAYNDVVEIYNKCLSDYMLQQGLDIPLDHLDIALVEPKIDGKYMGYDQPASILFRRYKAGTVMPFHEDSIHREYGGGFTALLYLNDDYKGGEVYFKDKNVTFSPSKGSLLIFPGHKMHEVLILEDGDRYVISAYFFKGERPDAERVAKEGFGSDGFEYWLYSETLPGNTGNIKHEEEEYNYKKPEIGKSE